jgi:hypothetical protein
MAKLLKPRAELESLILDQVRANPDWRRIRSIVVIPTLRCAPHDPNWDAAFVVDGAALRPPDA